MKTQIPSITNTLVIRKFIHLGCFAIFNICLLLTFETKGQKILYDKIKSTKNIDSLEKAFQKNLPGVYLMQLLVLEKSWFELENPRFGSKLNELQDLAVGLKKEDALPTINYLRANVIYNDRFKKGEIFRILTEALRGYENLKDTVGIIKVLTGLTRLTIGNIAKNYRNADASIDFAKKLVKITEQFGNKGYLLQSLGIMANAYHYKSNQPEKVKEILLRMERIIGNDKGFEEHKSDISGHWARIYARNKQYQKAYETIKQYEEFNKQKRNVKDYYSYLLNLSNMCLLAQKYEEAQKNIEYVQKRTKGKDFILLRERVYIMNRRLYKAQKNYKIALEYSDSLNTLQEKIYKTENIENLNELEVSYKTKEFEIKNIALAKENELALSRNRIIMAAVIGATVSILVLSMLLFYLYRGRKKAQLQAEEINRLSQIRDQYIRIIAHDLRSPIYAMQGMYDMVSNAIKTKRLDDLQRISNYIDETGIKTKHLLDNLMNWGMTQQDEIAFEPQKLNVLENLNEVISIYDPLKVIKDFDIRVNCHSEHNVYADKQGFQLILRNLVDNAIKNLPTRNGIIDILVSADVDNSVSITIKDNGKGFAEEKLATINSVFNQPLSTTVGKNGLGMGITLIGKFVKRNKGSIIAKSVLNSGSRFILSLPISS
ncbi:MAG: ATP-binding protein [Spirosomataceae bacterium]